MLTPILKLSFLWMILFSISAVQAELGPADRAQLPPTDLNRIKVGDPAPDFTLEDMDGKRVRLSAFRGKKRVILVFYRGRW